MTGCSAKAASRVTGAEYWGSLEDMFSSRQLLSSFEQRATGANAHFSRAKFETGHLAHRSNYCCLTGRIFSSLFRLPYCDITTLVPLYGYSLCLIRQISSDMPKAVHLPIIP